MIWVDKRELNGKQGRRVVERLIEAGFEVRTDREIPTGDYQMTGPRRRVVERKGSAGELAYNLSDHRQGSNCMTMIERFTAELERARRAGAEVLIVVYKHGGGYWDSIESLARWKHGERTWEQEAAAAGMTGEEMVKRLKALQREYGFKIIFSASAWRTISWWLQ